MMSRSIQILALASLVLAMQVGCADAGTALQSNEADTSVADIENELDQAVLAFAENPTPETEANMGRVLLTSTVYLKVADSYQAEASEATARRPISVWSVALPDGRNAMAMYTSKARFAAAFAEAPATNYIGVTGRSALVMAANSPVAINWGVDPHVYWNAELTADFLAMP